MMKKLLSLLLAVVIIATFGACGDTSSTSSDSTITSSSDEPQPFPVTVRDVTIGAKPTRVVSLSPMITELICSFGYEDTLVARSTNCVFSTAVFRLPDVGTAAEPKLEDIIKLSPEYVFTTQPLSEDTLTWLSKNNIAVITIDRPNSVKELAGLYSDLTVIFEGKLDGLVKAAKNAQAFTDKLDELKLKIEKYRNDNSLSDAVSVMMIHSLNNYIAAGSTLENDILEYIGISNAASDSEGYFVSDDALKSINPHYIIISSEVDADELSTKSAYRAKAAVKNGDIISVDTSSIEKCSVSLISTFYEIVEVMYPGVTDVELSSETVSQ